MKADNVLHDLNPHYLSIPIITTLYWPTPLSSLVSEYSHLPASHGLFHLPGTVFPNRPRSAFSLLTSCFANMKVQLLFLFNWIYIYVAYSITQLKGMKTGKLYKFHQKVIWFLNSDTFPQFDDINKDSSKIKA